MRKLFVLTLVLLTVSLGACTTIVQGGVSQVYSPVLQHTRVTVVNNCSSEADLELGGQVVKSGLKYGESFTVVITRAGIVSQNSVDRVLIFKARIGETYLGSSTRRYRLDANRSGNEEVWEVSNVRTANGSGGCGT
ncbi:MAG TPA: hypothetical protein PLD99_00845 [Parcubacteria group bacterium]|nr:hypothetical protein [Parcubacteria group bacterium]